MTGKTDKELAVEIAKAYIEASANRKMSNGSSMNLPPVDSVNDIIKATYNTLKDLN